jgi:CheY-like chemotaxis protein
MALMKTPLPVIILTAHVLQSYEEAAAKFDIKNFIRKPFKADEVRAVACLYPILC